MDPEQHAGQLQRSFVPPSELDSSRPREVSLTAAGKALVATAILLFAAALVVGVVLERVVARQAEDRRSFAADGVDASAAITRLWRESSDSKQPWVAYRFEVAGVAHDGQSRIRLSTWRTLRVGSTLPVRYLPTNPRRNIVAGAVPGALPPWLPVFVAGLIGSAGVLCLLLLNRQRRLLMDGRPAPAVVTALVNLHSSHGGAHRSIRYTFPLLSGAMATGKSDATRKAPAVGSVICVIYDPDQPRRSKPYPFVLVQPVRLAIRPVPRPASRG